MKDSLVVFDLNWPRLIVVVIFMGDVDNGRDHMSADLIRKARQLLCQPRCFSLWASHINVLTLSLCITRDEPFW